MTTLLMQRRGEWLWDWCSHSRASAEEGATLSETMKRIVFALQDELGYVCRLAQLYSMAL